MKKQKNEEEEFKGYDIPLGRNHEYLIKKCILKDTTEETKISWAEAADILCQDVDKSFNVTSFPNYNLTEQNVADIKTNVLHNITSNIMQAGFNKYQHNSPFFHNGDIVEIKTTGQTGIILQYVGDGIYEVCIKLDNNNGIIKVQKTKGENLLRTEDYVAVATYQH